MTQNGKHTLKFLDPVDDATGKPLTPQADNPATMAVRSLEARKARARQLREAEALAKYEEQVRKLNEDPNEDEEEPAPVPERLFMHNKRALVHWLIAGMVASLCTMCAVSSPDAKAAAEPPPEKIPERRNRPLTKKEAEYCKHAEAAKAKGQVKEVFHDRNGVCTPIFEGSGAGYAYKEEFEEKYGEKRGEKKSSPVPEPVPEPASEPEPEPMREPVKADNGCAAFGEVADERMRADRNTFKDHGFDLKSNDLLSLQLSRLKPEAQPAAKQFLRSTDARMMLIRRLCGLDAQAAEDPIAKREALRTLGFLKDVNSMMER